MNKKKNLQKTKLLFFRRAPQLVLGLHPPMLLLLLLLLARYQSYDYGAIEILIVLC